MRVCYFGTYRAEYTRNRIMIEGLRRTGAEIFECHEQLWHGIEDRERAAKGGWLSAGFLWRVLRTYVRLLRKYRSVPEYDVLMLGYPGQLDSFIAKLLAWLRRRPMVVDGFMSIYLVACERKLAQKHRVTGKLIYGLEKASLALPDAIIVMSEDYLSWFEETFGVDPKRLKLVHTGADELVYRRVAGAPDPRFFTVLYYGSYIYTHGVPVILEAARLLEAHSEIRFVMIGRGPVKEDAVRQAEEDGLGNVEFIDWVDREELPAMVASSDLCLGVFGTTPQADMTIQNKIWEGLAMARPILTGSSSAVRHWLVHKHSAYLCEMDDPRSLADGILELKEDPALREKLAANGHELFQKNFTISALGEVFRQHLEDVVAGVA